jgi:hypothetical protein
MIFKYKIMRDTGYYWVKQVGSEVWEPARWDGDGWDVWYLIGDERCYLDFEFEEIGEPIKHLF